MRAHITFTIAADPDRGYPPHSEGLQFSDLQMGQALTMIGVLQAADNVTDVQVRYVCDCRR